MAHARRPPLTWLDWLLILAGWRTPATPAATIDFRIAPIQQGSSHMANALVGTITPGPADPNIPVVKRTVSVTAGGVLHTLDATHGPVSFPCAMGDTYGGTLIDTSAGGIDSQPYAFSGIAHDNTTAPATPTAAITFAIAPAAA